MSFHLLGVDDSVVQPAINSLPFQLTKGSTSEGCELLVKSSAKIHIG